MIFAYGPPIVIGIWGVVACILFLGILASKADGKGKILGMLGIHVVCCYGYFQWYSGMLGTAQPAGYSHIPAVVALLVFVVVVGLGNLLSMMGIPSFLVFLLYLGIAIWGV